MKKNLYSSKWAWGTFFLLIAAFILSNQLGGFLNLGLWSVIIAALAVAFMVQCVMSLSFGTLPIPIAALYYIFQSPLGLPYVSFWPLVLVTLLVTCGLHALLPHKRWEGSRSYQKWADCGRRSRGENDEAVGAGVRIEEGEDDNNPYIKVQFGSASRYLHADCMETAELSCNCGSLEVYFDHVQLSPDGAEAYVNCKLGNLEMYLPKEWRVVDRMGVSLGNVGVDDRFKNSEESSPTLTIKGNVSLGNVEVHRI